MAKAYREKAELQMRVDDRAFNQAMNRMKVQARKDGEAIRKNLVAGMALGAAAGVSVKMFADFEQGLAGVRKTTGMAGKELERFGKDIRAMARDSTFGTDQLLEIAQAAGQLGVQGSAALLEYTDTISKLGSASDLAGEEAAFALSRISNIMKISHSNVDNLASAVVALGNNYASTESEIADTAQTIAAGVAVYGVSTQAVLGYATALNAMGQGGEAAGTSLMTFFNNMEQAVKAGGADLQKYAQIMGMTGEEVTRVFNEDIDQALILFSQGLGRYGKDASAVLRDLGITEKRVTRRLLALSQNSGILTSAVEKSNEAWEENTALLEEYKQMTDTLKAQWTLLVNKLKELTIEMGSKLAPAARAVTDALNEFMTPGRSKTLASWLLNFGRIVAVLVTLKLGFHAARFALVALTLAGKAGTLAMRIFWGAATLGLSTFIAFLPEIYAWFMDKIVPALKVVGLGFKGMFLNMKEDWKSFQLTVLQGMLKLMETLRKGGEFFGITVGDKVIASLNAMIIKTSSGLGAVRRELRQTTEDAQKAYHALQLTQAGVGVGRNAFDTGRGEPATSAPATPTEETQTAEELGTGKEAPGRGPSSVQFGPNPFNRRTTKEMMDQALVNAENELAKEAYEERQRLADEEVERDLARQRYKLATELELVKMHREEADEEELAYYERKRELEAERDELEQQEDSDKKKAELLRNQRHLDALEAQLEAHEKRKRNERLKNAADAVNELSARSKKLAGITAAFAKAQALHTLLTKTPAHAADAFGVTMAALPYPINAPAAAAAYAAVMAKGMAAVAAAENVQVPGAREGAVVPGSFALDDNQLYGVSPGETIVPRKNYADVEAGIRQRMEEEMRGDGELWEEDREPIPIELRGEAGQIFRQAEDALAVTGT